MAQKMPGSTCMHCGKPHSAIHTTNIGHDICLPCDVIYLQTLKRLGIKYTECQYCGADISGRTITHTCPQSIQAAQQASAKSQAQANPSYTCTGTFYTYPPDTSPRYQTCFYCLSKAISFDSQSRPICTYHHLRLFPLAKQGNDMPKPRTIELSNGDTEDWVRLDFEIFSPEGKIVKSIMDISLQKSDRTFDMRRKCWFVRADLINPLIAGIKSIISTSLTGWRIEDRRVTLEAFEDFFEQSPKPVAKAKTYTELVVMFNALVSKAVPDSMLIAPHEPCTIQQAKPIYRRCALALHPDRNNGDGSRMSELNMIWGQLQPLLK